MFEEVRQAWKFNGISEAPHSDAESGGRFLEAGRRLLLGLVAADVDHVLVVLVAIEALKRDRP